MKVAALAGADADKDWEAEAGGVALGHYLKDPFISTETLSCGLDGSLSCSQGVKPYVWAIKDTRSVQSSSSKGAGVMKRAEFEQKPGLTYFSDTRVCKIPYDRLLYAPFALSQRAIWWIAIETSNIPWMIRDGESIRRDLVRRNGRLCRDYHCLRYLFGFIRRALGGGSNDEIEDEEATSQKSRRVDKSKSPQVLYGLVLWQLGSHHQSAGTWRLIRHILRLADPAHKLAFTIVLYNGYQL